MKKLLIYVLLLVSAFVLVGCSNTNNNDDNNDDANNNNQDNNQDDNQQQEENNIIIADDSYTVETIENLKAQSAGSVKVSFRIPFGTTIQDVIREFADEFQAEYPSVAIELDVVSGYDDMKKATIQDINGGVVPTMTVGYPDHFAEYLISKSIISLDKFIASEEVGYSVEELEDFLPGYVQENRQFDNKGSYVGLPFNKSTEALYYNADFFEQYNLKVPETWEEFEAVAAQIMEIVNDPALTDSTYPWFKGIKTSLTNGEFIPCLYDSGGNLFTTIIHQFGGEYTNSIYKSNGLVDVQRGTLKFNTSPEALTAITYLQEIANKGYFNMPDKLNLQYGSAAFNTSNAIMNIGSTGGSSYYSSAICNMEVAPIPYKDADHKYVIQQGTNVCIMSAASDLEKLAAWLFIKHMLTPENTAEFAVRTGYCPVRSSAYNDQDYLDYLDSIQIGAKVHKAIARYASEGWNYFVDAAWAGSANVREECEAAIATILCDNANIEQALKDAVGRIG